MPAKKEDDELQPTFYYQPPRSLVQELLHLANAMAIIDLTAGAGTWALAAIERHVPYFGVGLSEMHNRELTAQLVRQAPQRTQNYVFFFFALL